MQKKSEIETIYAVDKNITFIMEYYYEDDKVVDIQCVGFYFGEPNEEKTREYFITHNK